MKLALDEVRRQARTMPAETRERFLCKNDLRHLCVEYLGYKDWDVIHDKVVEFLYRSEKNFKLLMLPRGHLKSSILTVGRTIQLILVDPNVRILLSNVKWGNAKNFLHQIKQYLTDYSKLSTIFGEFRQDAAGGWNRENIIINQRTVTHPEPTIQTSGVESEQTSQHYDYIFHDDIVARDNIGTPEQCEKVKNYYKDSLSLLEPDGQVYVLGTTWSDSDLYSELKDDETFDVLILPAYKQWFDAGGVVRRDILFPKKFSYEKLMELKKRLGPYQFGAQYMLNPYPEESQEFKKSWIQYYEDLPDDNYFISMVLDPSLGKKNSHFAGLTTTAINADGDVYILEARHFKRSVDMIPNEVGASAAKHKPHVFGLEKFAFQQVLEGPIRAEMKRLGLKTIVELLPYKSEDKATRIQGLIPKFAEGRIYMKQDMMDLQDELLKFNPARRRNQDDIIDSLAWHNVFWERKPTLEAQTQEEVEGSFNWWLRMNHKKKSLFSDFQKDSVAPQWIN